MVKRVRDSYTEQVQSVQFGQLNGSGRLFGGQLMQWIDVVGGVVAMRHSNSAVTTATIDSLDFLGPAHASDVVVLQGRITYVGRTSMEVKVSTYVENLIGERTLINVAYLVFVAIDENEKPKEVPRLILETEEEKSEWEAAVLRNEHRKQRRK